MLEQLVDIINEEMDLDKRLIVLCERDSRLGFHSEAEGYKYFPDKIRWRMQQLQNVIKYDVPELEKIIRRNKPLFPEYTGKRPVGAIVYAVPSNGSLWSGQLPAKPGVLSWQVCNLGGGNHNVSWAASYDNDFLYIIVLDSAAANQAPPVSSFVIYWLRSNHSVFSHAGATYSTREVQNLEITSVY